ncbi:adenosylcobinamide-phosphate synthase CbiB [Desulfovibrio ferrophilus]|uniref:adenosylcobinamide-phosphate synthase CbiB n=1 Tax=Desulfovibrio ferrophilus TaxID=241368 RepID=UPI001E465A65|nr:adenosylcobinamide-phosphate synthase CbiB [Desulfovibrio ferrophilus]
MGDPHGWPHPVRWLGRAANVLEAWARGSGRGLRWRGVLCAWTLALGAGAAVLLIVSMPLFGGLVALYLAYAGLALGALLSEGRKVLVLVESGDLSQAREAVGMLVSRDTAGMNEDEVRRALAETLSENLCDGLVAPFFYLVLLGPAGLWAYKAISTLDSMWGYRTEKWRELGWAAARTDDVLAYVPARLTAVALVLGGWAMSGRLAPLAKVCGDARRMESPNAGWPMAAAAWAVQATMGGRTLYFGAPKDKPVLGPEGQPWTQAKLRVLLRLISVSGVGCALALWLGGWLLF